MQELSRAARSIRVLADYLERNPDALLRGKGVGLMPTLDEVLATFPGKRFVINIKSNDTSEGEKLATLLTHAGVPGVHAHLIDLSDAALARSVQALATI